MKNEEPAIDTINRLIGEYEFPLPALETVWDRLRDCQEEHYVRLQLRYLENLINYGHAKRREE